MNSQLKALFNETDYVCWGDLKNYNITPASEVGECNFFSINPIHGKLDFDHHKKDYYKEFKPRRADKNVTSFRNFLFEFDSISLTEQEAILEKIKKHVTTIVYSGSKSYHAIVSLNFCLGGVHTENGIQHYKQIWRRLAAYINQLHGSSVIDESCKNPSRLSRIAGAIRENGNEQALTHIGSRLNLTEFNNLLSQCPTINSMSSAAGIPSNIDIKNLNAFMAVCPEGLLNELKFCPWADSAGMYPIIFRLTKWAIDSTQVPKEILLEFMESHTFKILDKVGYPKSKHEVAVNHAYGDLHV